MQGRYRRQGKNLSQNSRLKQKYKDEHHEVEILSTTILSLHYLPLKPNTQLG